MKRKALTQTDIEALIIQKAIKYNLDPALIKAIVKVESDFNPEAFNPSDPSIGLCQITPGLAQDFGLIYDHENMTQEKWEQIKNPDNNLEICCWFLSKLLRKYDLNTAILMYNCGESGYFKGNYNLEYLNDVLFWYNKYRVKNA